MATDRIEATYEVVTPLFCGGARPETAELRLPSFKGVLRWWWRALAWSRCEGDLERVESAENELFGSAHGGQGKVVMRLLRPPSPSTIKTIRKGEVLRSNGEIVGEGARYLGYGVMEAFGRKNVQAGQLTRACLQAPFVLEIELRSRDLDEPARASLLDALRAVGLLGGVGAKSRKGYGSLVLRSLAVNGEARWSSPASRDDLTEAIRQVALAGRKTRQDGLPPYTALSPRTRVVLVFPEDQLQPLALLDRVGREMMRFRSWGHDGRVLGTPSEENFKDDHDLMKKRPDERTCHPRRIVFGLPHNYGRNRELQVGPADAGIDRRASPLLVHVHECGKRPVAVLAFLPAQFLPGGDAAGVDVGGKRVRLASDRELWQPLEALLDRFLDPEKRKEPLGNALEVRP